MEQDIFNRRIEAVEKRLAALTDEQRESSAGLWDELSAALGELRAAGEALHWQGESQGDTRMANSLLRSLFDVMPVGIVICDGDGTILMNNPAAEAVLGSIVVGDVHHPKRAYSLHWLDGTPFPAEDVPLVQALENGEVVRDVEILIRRADGEERVILAGAAPVRNEAGHIISGVAVFQDVTSQKQAEEAMENLARFPSENPNPVIRVMKDGTIHYSNQGAQCLLNNWGAQVGEHVPDEWQALVAEALEAGLDRTAEIPCNRRTFTFTIVPVVESAYVNLYGLDISERKQAEEARERLAAILEATPDIVSTSTVDGYALYLNRTARRLLGIPDGASPLDWVIPAGYPGWASEIVQREGIPTALREGYWEGETAVFDGDGREIPVSQVIIAHRDENGEVAYLSAIARDVTEYKRLMADLEEERTRAENERCRLEAVMEALPVGVAVTDALRGGLQVNEAYDLVWGGPRPALTTVDDYTAYQAWWADTGRAVAPEEWASAQAVQKGESVIGQLLEIQRFDGARAFVINSASPIYDVDGNIVGSAVAIQDITDLQKAEEALRETRDYLDNLLTYANAPIIVWDPDFKITRFNAAFERLTGRKADDVCGKSLDLLFPEESKEEALAHIRHTAAGEHWEVVEIPILRVDRTVRTVLWNSATLYAADGTIVVATIAQGQDITERKQAEESLLENEVRLKRAQEIAHLGSWELDVVNNVLTWSDEVYRIFGLKPQEFGATYEAFLEAVHADDRTAVDAAYSGSLQEGRDTYEIEHRIVRKSTGEVRNVHEKCEHIRDETGRIIRSVGMVHDITERRQAREERERLLAALDQERRTLRAIMENTPTHLAYLDPQFNFVMVNSTYARGAGYAEEQLVGRNHFELFPHEENRAIFERVRETGEPVKFIAKPFEFPDRPELGTTYWDWTLAPVKDAGGELQGLVLSLMDVTEQEQARQRLRRYADRLRVLHETDQAILAARSVDEIAESALNRTPQLLEGCVRASVALYDPEQEDVSLLAVHAEGKTSLGKGWRGPMDPTWVSVLDELNQGKPHVIEDLQAVPATSTVVGMLQAEGVRAYVTVPLLIEGELIGSLNFGMSDPGGPTPGKMEVAHELAVQLAIGIYQARLNRQVKQHAEELEKLVARRTWTLRDREARLRAIFDNAALGIAVIDLEGRLLEANRAFQAMLGYGGDELCGMHFSELAHPEDVEVDLALFRELTAGERDSYVVEKRYVRKDGQVVDVRLNASLIRSPHRKPRFGIGLVEDITAQKQAQEALVRAEKLTITGRLAASLAHEINNPLQSVIGCLGLAQESLEAGEEEDVRELLQIAAEELERAASFVSDLRDLSRPSDPGDRRPVEVNLRLEHVLMLTREQCQKLGVEVVWAPAEGLPMLSLVPNRIHQVFLNLVLNALEAMPDGGRLRIGTDCTGDPPWVRVTFADTGSGIVPDDLSRLFDLFYTTKAEGLGLGLYITRNIVEEHGGRIEVESKLGEGTTFTVWLPVEEGTRGGES